METTDICKNFPDTEIEFDTMFSTEEHCVDYLFKQRWADGFKCLKCGKTHYWKSNRDLYICTNCEHQHSITAGTIFHQTHKPLKYWFKAIWWFTTTKSGISATNLSRLLGISYPTAWAWLQKLKRCTVNPNREPLSGTVEVDEFYLGGKMSGKQGRGSENKHKVVVAVERRESDDPEIDLSHLMGRVRIAVIPDCSAENLTPFIKSNISFGSTLITDKWTGYTAELKKNYTHESYKFSENKSVLDHVHRIASLVKRWFIGTLQGSKKPQHLQKYMDEYVFRFNRRNSESIGFKFFRLIQFAVDTKPITYNMIIGKLVQA
jgi:transposase-like protein